MKSTEKQQRASAAYQFELHAHKLYLSVVQRHSNYRYQLLDELSGQVIMAMVLMETFDFYEYRLNHGRARIQLLIVQEHNAIVPVDCLELKTGTLYRAGQAPSLALSGRKRRNDSERKLLLSHLILETEHAHQALAAMPSRTRQRYMALKRGYLRPRVGRPLAS